MNTCPVTSSEPGANRALHTPTFRDEKTYLLAMLTLAPLASIASGWKVSKFVDSLTDYLNGAKSVIAEAVDVSL